MSDTPSAQPADHSVPAAAGASPRESGRRAQVDVAFDAMVRHRRHLHRHPEVGLELPDTHAYVERALREYGLPVEAHPAAGITTRIPGSTSGRPVVLRADMDALPVAENTGLPFASARPGAMHACGHDLHTATLLGVAEILAQHPPARDTVLAFQPGEEADRGAMAVLAHESLRRMPDESDAFAVHVHARHDPGTVWLRSGTFMAFGDWFEVHVTGPGGHASQPQLVGNPIDAVADIAVAVRAVVAATAEPLVATVTEVLAGNTVNVIPASARVRGTIRTLSARARAELIDAMHALIADVAAERGLTGELTIHEGYPAVVNDAQFVGALRKRLIDAGHAALVRDMAEPSMVIEDFSYFLHRWRGAMVYVGARGEGSTSFNHSDDVLFDEGAMATSALLYLLVTDGI